MGQKVNPVGFRLSETREWQSKWIARRGYGKLLSEDISIRDYIKKKLENGAVTRVEIQRAADKMKIVLSTARPGIVIGRKGTDVDRLREELQEMTGGEVSIDIEEIKKPELSAELVARNIAQQLVRRISFRRAMKKSVASVMSAGAKGIKITCSGRLGGAEMCRTEWYKEGRVPLHTLRADIDYACVEAKTVYGLIGVKTWIYKGEFPLLEEERERNQDKNKKPRAGK